MKLVRYNRTTNNNILCLLYGQSNFSNCAVVIIRLDIYNGYLMCVKFELICLKFDFIYKELNNFKYFETSNLKPR